MKNTETCGKVVARVSRIVVGLKKIASSVLKIVPEIVTTKKTLTKRNKNNLLMTCFSIEEYVGKYSFETTPIRFFLFLFLFLFLFKEKKKSKKERKYISVS